MKTTLFTFSFLLFAFYGHSQRVNYPPAPSSVYSSYSENSVNQLKSTLWSDDISDPLNWSFTNSSIPVNDWTIETDPELVSVSGPFQSTSVTNGFLFFKSDTTQGAMSDAYTEFAGAQIDLTGEANIRIQFEQQFISDSNQRTLEVSPDGITWFPFVISDGISPTGAKEDDLTSIDISSAAGNAPDLHFRFHFSGSQEGYWAIDDIELRSIDSVDLRAVSVDWGTNGAWGVRMPYYSITPSQVRPIEFCAVIANDGLNDVDSAHYSVVISSTLFNNTDTFSIQSGSTDTVCLSSTFVSSGSNIYTSNQSIDAGVAEVNVLNNDFNDFQFREDYDPWSIYARDNLLTGVQGGIVGLEGLGMEYSVGNVFDIFTYDYSSGINVHIHPEAQQGSSVVGLLYVFDQMTYEWNLINQTLEYIVHSSDLDQEVTLYFGWFPFELVPNHTYLVMAGTYSNGNANPLFATSGKSKPNTSFYNSSWSANSFDLTYLTETPMVRLWFNPENLNEYQSNFNFNIAPNPSNQSTTLSFDLPSSSSVSFELIDLSGKKIRQIEPNLFSEGNNQLELTTTDLMNGVYLVKFTSDLGSTTKRIVIQH